MACPDKQLISEYYDGELSSPFKERLEAHLGACAECKTALDDYGRLSGLLDLGAVDEAAAEQRVWPRIESAHEWRRHSRMRTFLSRRVALPMPAAIAAAALVLFFAALILRTGLRTNVIEPDFVAGAVIAPDEIQQINTMGDALRYIENDELFSGVSGNYVIMRMPENRTFYNSSDPQIRNASSMPTRGGALSAP